MNIDPLCLSPRTLEVCRPAAERAEERVAVAAATVSDPEIAAEVTAHACQSMDSHTSRSDTNQRRKPQSPVVRAGQRPSGQAALAAAYPATRGWRV